MNFREFLDEIQGIKFEEMRGQTESSLEVVVSKENLGKIVPVLEAYFGPALKPQGCQPTGESDYYSKPYGGVRQDQTLYFRKDDKSFVIAMLWPWGSGISVTVKILRGQIAESYDLKKKPFWKTLFGR